MKCTQNLDKLNNFTFKFFKLFSIMREKTKSALAEKDI